MQSFKQNRNHHSEIGIDGYTILTGLRCHNNRGTKSTTTVCNSLIICCHHCMIPKLHMSQQVLRFSLKGKLPPSSSYTELQRSCRWGCAFHHILQRSKVKHKTHDRLKKACRRIWPKFGDKEVGFKRSGKMGGSATVHIWFILANVLIQTGFVTTTTISTEEA
jgi:hypothetical protein